MANLASTLKEEISRLARQEIRRQTAGTAKSVAQCEREISALKKQLGDLRNKFSASSTKSVSGRASGRKAGGGKAAAKKKAGSTGAADAGRKSSRSSFSVQGLKSERERLGLSADNYGKLIGVSGLSIYNWEQGKTSPRESSVAAMMSIKGIGKREAASRLGDSPAPKARTGVKKKAKAGKKTKAAARVKAKDDGSAENGGAVASEGQDGNES